VIRTGFFYVATSVSTLFFSVTAVVGGLTRAGRGWYDWVHRNWARSVLWAAGVEVRVEGLQHVRPYEGQLFMSNHQSMFDIWTMMATLPASLRFVTKAELGRVPIFGAACRSAGHVFIDRRDPVGASQAIRAAGERMTEEGLSLVLFPEGTRSPDGGLRRFKRGSFSLAIETQEDLIPVAIDGGARVLPKGARKVRPGVIRLECGPSIRLRGLTIADRDDLTRRTRQAVESMLEGLQGEGEAALPPGDA